MNTLLKSVILFLLAGNSCLFAQDFKKFNDDFLTLSKEGFSKTATDGFIKENRKTLFSSNFYVTESNLDQKGFKEVFIKDFSSSLAYQSHIDVLLESSEAHKAYLGKILVVAMNDFSKIGAIEKLMAKSEYKDIFAAQSYLQLKSTDLNGVLKTILNYKNRPEVNYLMAQFLASDPGFLERFGVDSIQSKDIYVRFLAVKSLAKSEYTEQKGMLLKKIVKDRDSVSGWALAVLAEMKSPKMAEVALPLLNDENLRQICYLSLANSSSPEDALLIDSLIEHSTDNLDLYVALSRASTLYSLKKYLKLVKQGNMPDDYYAYYDPKSHFNNFLLHDDVCNMLRDSKDRDHTRFFYNFFQDWKDELTTKFLLEMLATATDANLIYAIVRPLKGRNSELVKEALPMIMKDATIEFSPILPLLEEYKEYSFKGIIQSWLDTNMLDSRTTEICRDYMSKS